MTTPVATYSAFALNNRPSVVEYNRNGQVNFNGSSLPSTIGQSWIPTLDNTYDLGQNTSPLRWRDLWLSRNASVVGALTAGSLTVANNAQFTNGPALFGSGGLRTYNAAVPDVGTSVARFGTGYFTNLDVASDITTYRTTTGILHQTGTSPATFGGPLYPLSAGSVDIGSAALPWKDVYFTGNLYKNGVLFGGGGGTLGDLLPPVDNTYIIGNNSFRWKSIRAAGDIQTDGQLITAGSITSSAGNLTISAGNANITGSLFVTGDLTVGQTGANIIPIIDNIGSVGTISRIFQYIYGNNGRFRNVVPYVLGVPSAGTTIGQSNAFYENGYIENMQSTTVVPRVDNTGSIGTNILRYANVYCVNLVSPFVTSGTYSPSVPVFNTSPIITLVGSLVLSEMNYIRVGTYYTFSYKWIHQVSSGWNVGEVHSTLDVIVTLPFASDAGVDRCGTASGGAANYPSFFGTCAATGGDTQVQMRFRNVTLPDVSITAGQIAFQCMFMMKRSA